MAAKTNNPFCPGRPVSPRAFAGRHDELINIDRCLASTRNGNSRCFIIEGEEGIGKTSLLRYVAGIACGDLPAYTGSKAFRFEVVTASLEPDDRLDDIIDKIADSIDQRDRQRHFDRTCSDKQVDPFSYLCMRIEMTFLCTGPSTDGLIILLDDADKPSKDANLGILCTALMHVIQKTRRNFCIGLAGSSTLVGKLRQSHAFAPRMFGVHRLKPLDDRESAALVATGLNSRPDSRSVRVSQNAVDLMCRLAGGYPHFLQEFCFHAFEADTDGIIDVTDLNDSLAGDYAALHQIGSRYFDPFNNHYALKEYHDVLRCFAESDDGRISIFNVARNTRLCLEVICKALDYWKEREMIFAEDADNTSFRIRSRAIAVWVRAHYMQIDCVQ